MRSLEEVLEEGLRLWRQGVEDARCAWRNPALATVSPDRRPAVRTVVLRRFDAGLRIAELHTDARSPKLLDIAAIPCAALHGWDADRRVQMRLEGLIARADEAAEQRAWDALHDGSRAIYRSPLPPGTAMPAPRPQAAEHGDEEAREVFRVLQLRFDRLEYLSLAAQPPCRALFRWCGDALQPTWLAP